MEGGGEGQEEIVTVLVGRLGLWPDWDQQEMNAQDGYEDTDCPEVFGVTSGQ